MFVAAPFPVEAAAVAPFPVAVSPPAVRGRRRVFSVRLAALLTAAAPADRRRSVRRGEGGPDRRSRRCRSSRSFELERSVVIVERAVVLSSKQTRRWRQAGPDEEGVVPEDADRDPGAGAFDDGEDPQRGDEDAFKLLLARLERRAEDVRQAERKREQAGPGGGRDGGRRQSLADGGGEAGGFGLGGGGVADGENEEDGREEDEVEREGEEAVQHQEPDQRELVLRRERCVRQGVPFRFWRATK